MIDNLEKYGFRKDFDFENRFKIRTDVKNKNGEFVVSTVDLGISHGFDSSGRPIYYETMVFKKNNDKIDFADLLCVRYATMKEAKVGHEEVVNYVKKVMTI